MSCLVRYGDIALPIACETIHKDILFSDVATKKEKRRAIKQAIFCKFAKT